MCLGMRRGQMGDMLVRLVRKWAGLGVWLQGEGAESKEQGDGHCSVSLVWQVEGGRWRRRRWVQLQRGVMEERERDGAPERGDEEEERGGGGEEIVVGGCW